MPASPTGPYSTVSHAHARERWLVKAYFDNERDAREAYHAMYMEFGSKSRHIALVVSR